MPRLRNRSSGRSTLSTTRLDYGFLERVYVKALLLELKKLGLAVASEVAIEVLYTGEVSRRVLRRSGCQRRCDR